MDGPHSNENEREHLPFGGAKVRLGCPCEWRAVVVQYRIWYCPTMPKIKCVVLIPLARNDGMPVGPVELRGILNRLLTEFGGYTVAGEVEGGWRSPTGVAHRERNTQVWVAVEPRQVAKLRRLVREIGRQLGQESMYLEITGGKVEILRVSPRGTGKS